ncbi:MAG: TetR/AcrR family transcriptional regulator [Massilia sp.]
MATTVVKKPRTTASKAVAPAAGAAATARTPRPRPQAAEVTRRLAPEDREQLIVEKAIKYFATHGFTASTRDLAREMGVSQPLLYRYFPNKEALADRVFHEVYLSRWNPEWEELLADRSRSLDERLRLFYKQYGKVILKSDWIRIFIFAGLTREGINQRYLERLRERIFNLVLAEMRREFKIAAPTPQQYEDEIEFIWGLHAAIFYVGVRKWIYGLSVPKDLDRLIDQKVDAFLDSAPVVFKRIRKAQARA